MASAKKHFRLYPRKRKDGTAVYYARFLLPDGTHTAGKSTGCTNPRDAENWAVEYIRDGAILATERTTLAEFARHFFDRDGNWAIDKLSAGKRLSERQCHDNQALTDNHLIPRIGSQRIADIDTATVKRLRNTMWRNGYSASTINKTIGCLRALLEAAEEYHLLRRLPKFERAADRPEERGILNADEVSALFAQPWDDYRAYVINLTAAATGLRRGELLALKRRHIIGNRIEVSGSYCDRTRKVKPTPKNGRKRTVPIPELVSSALSQLMERSPYGNEPDSFIFYAERTSDKPMEGIIATRELYRQLRRIGISEEERRERKITFHSHRHWFNSLLVESRIPLQKIQRLTGHLSPSMMFPARKFFRTLPGIVSSLRQTETPAVNAGKCRRANR